METRSKPNIWPLIFVPALAAGAAWAVRGKSSSLVAPSRWRGDQGRRSIALSFDDGPSESTAELVALLAGFGVPATFFQVGANARRLPELAKAVSAAGHEIGNHTDTHPRLWLRSPAFIRAEIAGAQDTLSTIHGAAPRLFRAPYGVRWPGLAAAQAAFGLEGVTWTAIGRDWTLPASAAANRLFGAARPGAIFCLHDGRELAIQPNIGETIELVRILVPRLLDAGYCLESVSSILCPTTSPNA
ncbi:MAG: polysaccharide deacetylase family protein [Bryobacteraceae bacterium]